MANDTDAIEKLRDEIKGRGLDGVDREQVWQSMGRRGVDFRTLAWEKLPAEAMAFYHPFHVDPADQWGIYLLLGPMMKYHHHLWERTGPLKIFSRETLMHLVLFEVFQHEFFHHLVEAAATACEILMATREPARSIYISFEDAQRANDYGHPHAPLEEALANAYAFNALGFISRVKVGFKTFSVRTYQKAIEAYWHREPAGYRDAGFYAGSGYVDGATALLEMILEVPGGMHRLPLAMIAKHVMPNGFSAFTAKPDIPTWLVGTDAELAEFGRLVPAPNEAYTQLFWPFDTASIDQYLVEQREKERRLKAHGPVSVGPS